MLDNARLKRYRDRVIFYDSSRPEFKSPSGALPKDTPVELYCSYPAARGVLEVKLDYCREKQEHPMQPDAERGWRISYLPPQGYVGLIWYRIRLETDGGILWCAPRRGVAGIGDLLGPNSGYFQLTVYDPARDGADWFGRGVTYQIFPDRFNRTALPQTGIKPGNRIIHRTWGDCPDLLPDPDGEIRNRDFFGGTLNGIRQKLPYLKSLSVSTVYLNPIFCSASNHRYDTSDYMKIDPMLGTLEDFRALCAEAEELGIKIMLDGVFNHTGSDSIYFNRKGTFEGVGAYQSEKSPYYSWYKFNRHPDEYDSWWGIKTLPRINGDLPECRAFLLEVVRYWLRQGASGWRLDVADELSDDFIAAVRAAAKEIKPDAVIIGEVWEDATNKVSYDRRRRYLISPGLDGVMNYPFRKALIHYLCSQNADHFAACMTELMENYPRHAFYSGMNILGTHDTPRILSTIGDPNPDCERIEYIRRKMLPYVRDEAIEVLKIAAAIQFCFPGSPCIYYADEAGVEGYGDPLNRRCYPWGHEREDLVEFYRMLGRLRCEREELKSGGLRFEKAEFGLLVFRRYDRNGFTLLASNTDTDREAEVEFDSPCACTDRVFGRHLEPSGGKIKFLLPPSSCAIICSEG